MGRPQPIQDVESNQDQNGPQQRSTTWRDWTIVFTWSFVGYLALMMTVIGYFDPSILPINPSTLFFNKDISPFYAFSRGSQHFAKPNGFKIVALVPFTNHERTSILDCYLQKNLIHNKGFLDQVVFIPQTSNPTDLSWLHNLVQETTEYAISPPGRSMDWKFAQENVMYIRIDGDIVYMEDQTIPTIIKTKLESPSENLMVSANVVNEGALASLHSHAGVALPYLPELSTHTKQPSREKSQLKHDWRASALPAWVGPEDFKVQRGFKAPFDGHRWLLPRGRGSASTSPSPSTSTSTSSISGVESGNLNNDRDPISASMFTDTGPSVHDWTVGAQQHYSFLHHLELDDLNRYKFPLWVNPTEPVSTNFGCFWGKDVRALRDVFGFKSDEEIYKSWTGSDEDRPNVTIDGKGVVSHYSSKQGVEGLDETDLLERYRAYALERVCRRETGMRSGMKKSLEVD